MRGIDRATGIIYAGHPSGGTASKLEKQFVRNTKAKKFYRGRRPATGRGISRYTRLIFLILGRARRAMTCFVDLPTASEQIKINSKCRRSRHPRSRNKFILWR